MLHDTTIRTWVVRHMARAMVQRAVPAPVAVLLLAVPGPFWIRGTAALGGVLLGLVFSRAYMPETAEHRLVEAGHPAGTAVRAHEAAQRERQEAESVPRRAAATRRAQRYRDRHGR